MDNFKRQRRWKLDLFFRFCCQFLYSKFCQLLFIGCGLAGCAVTEKPVLEETTQDFQEEFYSSSHISIIDFLLDKAGGEAERGNIVAARSWLTELDVQDFDDNRERQYTEILFLIDFHEGYYYRAIDRFDGKNTQELWQSRAERLKWWDYLAQSYVQVKDYVQALHHDFFLLAMNPDSLATDLVVERIWYSIQRLPYEYRKDLLQSFPDAKAWLELAQLERSKVLQPKGWRTAVQQWLLSWSEHKARPYAERLLEWESVSLSNKIIALLLPLSGEHAEVGQRVLEGFLAHYYWHSQVVDGFVFKIIDSSKVQDINAQIRRIQDVMDPFLIVGPLERRHVWNLDPDQWHNTRVLALNHLQEAETGLMRGRGNDLDEEDFVGHNFVYYSLSIAEETAFVLERAYQKGYDHMLIVYGEDEWMEKNRQDAIDLWRAKGEDYRVEAIPSGSTFAKGIQEVLEIDKSYKRLDYMQRLLKMKVNMVPRVRQDIDFILLAGGLEEAAQISPTLSLYGADIPTYGRALARHGRDTYDGQVMKDLDSILFTDFPVLLDDGYPIAIIDKNYFDGDNTHQRFFAFGLDVYHLAVREIHYWLNEEDYGFYGFTGYIHRDQWAIEQEPIWGRYSKGAVEIASGSEGLGSSK